MLRLNSARQVQEGKDDGRMLVFTPPRHADGSQKPTIDVEESSDLTSEDDTRQVTLINSHQMEQLTSQIKIVREQQDAMMVANESAKQAELDARARLDQMVNEKVMLVEERASLRHELEKAKVALRQYRTTTDTDMEELAQHNEQLENENGKLVSQVSTLQERMEALQKEMVTYQDKIEELETQTLPESEAELEVARRNLESERQNTLQVQEETALCKQKIEELQQQLESASSSIKAVQSESGKIFQSLKQENTILQQQNSKTSEDNAALEQRVEQLSSELSECKEKLIQLETETLSGLQLQLQEAEDKVRNQQETNASLHDDLSSYKAQMEKLQDDVEKSKQEHDKLSMEASAEMEAIARDNERLEQEKENLLSANEEYKQNIGDLTLEIRKLEEKVNQLETEQLPEKNARVAAALEELQTEQQKVSSLEANVCEIQKRVNSLEMQLEETKKAHENELAGFQQRNEESLGALEQLRVSESSKTNEIKSMEDELTSAHARVRELDDRAQELDDALNETMAQLDGSQAEKAALIERVQQMKSDAGNQSEKTSRVIQDLEQGLAESMKREASLKAERDKLHRESEKHGNDLELLESKLQDKSREYEKYKSFMASSNDRERELHEQLLESDQVRRGLHARVMQLMGNIRVFVRVRPMLADEVQQEQAILNETADGKKEQTLFKFPTVSARSNSRGQKKQGFEPTTDLTKMAIEVVEPKKDRGGLKERRARHNFHFDNVFQQDHSQEDVWESTEPLVQSTVDGYNVTLFAYGQTGSGKTYTMLGEPRNEGIITRSIKKLFSDKKKVETLSKGSWRGEIKTEVLEIYNENVYDLLSSNNIQDRKSLKVSMTTNTVDGNIQQIAATEEECLDLLDMAQKRRCTKSTSSNAESSRSHLVFTIHYTVSENNRVVRHGKLNICDLAGSERLSKSEAHVVGVSSMLCLTKMECHHEVLGSV